MIHGDHGIELAVAAAQKHRVRRPRPIDIDLQASRFFDGRRQNIDLFGTKVPTITRMRVQGGDTNPRASGAGGNQCVIRKLDCIDDTIDIDCVGNIAKRNMAGHSSCD